MRILAAIWLVWLLVAAPALSQTPDDRLIVPGQRIGRWSLGATVADLTRAAGPATTVQEAADGNRAPMVVYSWSPPGIAAVTRDRSRVEFLYLYGAADFRTDKGIGRGSAAEAARKAYGRPVLTDFSPFLRGLVYDKIGLALLMTSNRVNGIIVFRPGTAEGLRLPAILPAAPVLSPEEPRS